MTPRPMAPVPEQAHGNPMVEIGLIGASVLSLVIIAVPTFREIYYSYDVPVESKADSYEITATGYQWWFKFDYPSETAQTLDATGKVVNAPFSSPTSS
jgi:cytochrome c oxidase subunit 2